MAEKAFIDEKALLYRLECPQRSNGSSTVPESPLLVCAEHTARWLIAEQVSGRAPTASETREFFDAEWKQTRYFQSRSGISAGEYELRVREGVRACRRLRDIIWRCEILQPVSPYELPIGEVVITGEYAVLRSSRRKKHAFGLYLRHQGVRIKRLVPDVVSFARRLDLANRWVDAANRHWAVQSIGVLHYWVGRDLSAEHTADYGFTREVLLGAADVVRGYPFPLPGDHCLSCPTRGCRPDESE
jgi:hypothetical protein